MKSHYTAIILIFLAGMIVSSLTAFGGENRIYQNKKIKSRTARGYSNHGTIIYNYQEIDHYSDDLVGEELGNLDPKSKVREIHNRIIVNDRIQSEKDELSIGKISVSGTRIKEIDNEVTIKNGISARGDRVSVGSVQIQGGRVDRVLNRVEIKGRVHAE